MNGRKTGDIVLARDIIQSMNKIHLVKKKHPQLSTLRRCPPTTVVDEDRLSSMLDWEELAILSE